jgi:hypothetical protein
MPLWDFSISIGCRYFKKYWQKRAQNQIKKFGMSSNPLFNDKKLLTPKTFINNIYVQFNCAYNKKKIIVYFLNQ